MSEKNDQIIRRLAAFAADFREKSLFPTLEKCVGKKLERTPQAYRDAIKRPLDSARVFLGFYAFARAGGEQVGYGEIACSILTEQSAFRDADAFLRAFQGACKIKGVGKNDRLNARVVHACFEKHPRGELTLSWLGELGQRIADTSRVLPTCLELLHIKGIGPKIAPFLCRDLVWAFEVEGKLPIVERIAMQPIDTWLRRIGHFLWPEFAVEKQGAVDVLLAGHIVAELDRLGVSGADFNQGAWYFGAKRVKFASALPSKLTSLGKSAGA